MNSWRWPRAARWRGPCRSANAELLAFYRRNFSGYEDAYWVNSAWQACSRDGRHIVGRKTLTVDMLKNGARPGDGVVPVVRKWGLLHSPKQKEGFAARIDSGFIDGTSQIPYGARCRTPSCANGWSRKGTSCGKLRFCSRK